MIGECVNELMSEVNNRNMPIFSQIFIHEKKAYLFRACVKIVITDLIHDSRL